MFHQKLDDKKKQEIAELWKNKDLSVEEIAIKAGVSLRSVYNYKDYIQASDENIDLNDQLNQDLDKDKHQVSQNLGENVTDANEINVQLDNKINFIGGNL